jgi:hypothetical protein
MLSGRGKEWRGICMTHFFLISLLVLRSQNSFKDRVWLDSVKP